MIFRIEDEWIGFTNLGPKVYEITGREPWDLLHNEESGFYNMYDVVVSY